MNPNPEQQLHRFRRPDPSPELRARVLAAARQAWGKPPPASAWAPLQRSLLAIAAALGPGLLNLTIAVGVAALCFHPRVAPDRRTQPVKLAHLRAIVQAVSIPVLGNGNLQTTADVLAMWEATGCAGFSIGRLAVARPWIFAQWQDMEGFAASASISLTMRSCSFCS